MVVPREWVSYLIVRRRIKVHGYWNQWPYIKIITIEYVYLLNEFIKVGAACISMHIMAAHWKLQNYIWWLVQVQNNMYTWVE
jgi:hypothetical protein